MKSPAVLLAAAFLAATLTAPTASATTLADPAPTNVKISWKDDTLKFVHVTWDEEGAQPNKIVVRRTENLTVQTVYVAADAPNQVDLLATALGNYGGVLEIAVAAGTEAGETGPYAASPRFDTILPNMPALVSYTMSGASTLTVKWKDWPLWETETTPNDPLDRTDSMRYSTAYSLSTPGEKVEVTKPGTAKEATVTGPGQSFHYWVTSHNEWGTRSVLLVYAHPSGLTAKIPTMVTAGTVQADVTGTFTPSTAQVILQARNTSASPWYTVAAQTFHGGRYRYELGLAGSRQYRVFVPHTPNESHAYFGGYSQVGAMTVQMNGWSSLTENSGRRGQTVRTHLQVRPKIDVKVRLERWNGKAWTTVGPVQVDLGNGYAYLKGVTPGRVAYRYYIPSGWIKGMWYAAKYTPNFFITTV